MGSEKEAGLMEGFVNLEFILNAIGNHTPHIAGFSFLKFILAAFWN